jgi:hypothetical protein
MYNKIMTSLALFWDHLERISDGQEVKSCFVLGKGIRSLANETFLLTHG